MSFCIYVYFSISAKGCLDFEKKILAYNSASELHLDTTEYLTVIYWWTNNLRGIYLTYMHFLSNSMFYVNFLRCYRYFCMKVAFLFVSLVQLIALKYFWFNTNIWLLCVWQTHFIVQNELLSKNWYDYSIQCSYASYL